MSDVFVGCSKCGVPLPVDESAFRNAILLGQEVTAAHDVCPGQEPEPAEAPPVRRFRIQLLLAEVTDPDLPAQIDWAAPDGLDLLAGTGTTMEADTFAKVVNGPFTDWLNRTWPKMQENAPFADLPGTTPTT